MAVSPSTRSHLDDHLRQAEFALQVASNFDCLKGTPAHESVSRALAHVAEVRGWVREKLAIEAPAIRPADLAFGSAREQRRIVHRRMARLAP